MSSENYFKGYAHTDIHAEMISDVARTRAYRRAILDNAELFEGKVVLDVGAGTGILSLFAAQAGARKVYACEGSEMALVARKVVEDNGLSDRITVLHGFIEDQDIPEPVDVIISEWMGYALFFEAMLKSVLFARDKWLAEGGRTVPYRSRVWVCGAEDFDLEAKRYAWWDDVYGFDLSAVAEQSRVEPLVDFIDTRSIATERALLADHDLETCTFEDTAFSCETQLVVTRHETLHSLVLWFDVALLGEIDLFTGPYDEETHWKQTLLTLPEPVQVRRGDVLPLSMRFEYAGDNGRSVRIHMALSTPDGVQTCEYMM